MGKATFLILFIPLSIIFCLGASGFAPGLVIFWLRGTPLPGLGTLSGATMALAWSVVVPAALILVAHLRGKSSFQPNLKLYPLAAVFLSFGSVFAYLLKLSFSYGSLLATMGPVVLLIACAIAGLKTKVSAIP